MKEYRNHNCNKKHRKAIALAKCVFPRGRISGSSDGVYASISWCYRRGGHSVHLHTTEQGAFNGKKLIDDAMCGGLCRGPSRHDVVKLILPEEM